MVTRAVHTYTVTIYSSEYTGHHTSILDSTLSHIKVKCQIKKIILYSGVWCVGKTSKTLVPVKILKQDVKQRVCPVRSAP